MRDFFAWLAVAAGAYAAAFLVSAFFAVFTMAGTGNPYPWGWVFAWAGILCAAAVAILAAIIAFAYFDTK